MEKHPEQTPAGIAASFINGTNCNIFLTGKAGTGKTTFLKEIISKTHKKTIVAAPTGIAAINAGGGYPAFTVSIAFWYIHSSQYSF